MGKKSGIHLVVVFAVLVFCPVGSSAKEASDYVVTAGGEKLTFTARAELGYVVKAAERTARVGVLAATLFIEDGDVTPVRGLDRHGIWVVEKKPRGGEYETLIKTLGANAEVEYIAPLFSSGAETVAIIPEIVVRVKPGTQTEQVQTICETAGCTIKKRMEFTEQEYLLTVLGPDADAVFAAVEQLNTISFVEWAAPNVAFRPRLCAEIQPNDEYFDYQWHLNSPDVFIDALGAWELTTGDPNIVVAVFDGGVDTNHADLLNNLVAGYDFWDDDDSPYPDLDDPNAHHGTCCAGLIAAQGNNSLGVTGVTWHCKIMPIRTMGDEGSVTDADIATAIRWAAGHGADIISNSWGTQDELKGTHSAIIQVTEPAGIGRKGKGCLVLAGSGNDPNQHIAKPAAFSEVIAVGATDIFDERQQYSAYGPELDLTAPSGGTVSMPGIGSWFVGLWTTDITGDAGLNNSADTNILDYTDEFAGTSGACPIAAGAAALILSVERNLTNEEVRHLLERSAKDLGDPGWDEYYGHGRVDARAVLDMVLAKRADLNGDWKVDWRDFAVLAQSWRTSGPEGDIGPAPKPDGFVDVHDVILMGQYWLEEIPSTGLRAHWRLDESEGDIAYDCIGNHNAVVHEGEWTEGVIDGALRFNGLRTYMDCGDSDVLGPEQMTLEMWIRPDHMGGMRYIVSRANNSTDEIDYALMRHLDGELEFVVGQLNGDPVSVLSTATTPLGEWTHVAVSLDGLQASIHINDELDGSVNYGQRVAREGHRLVISSHQASTRFYNGKIDDVRIYDRAVSP